MSTRRGFLASLVAIPAAIAVGRKGAAPAERGTILSEKDILRQSLEISNFGLHRPDTCGLVAIRKRLQVGETVHVVINGERMFSGRIESVECRYVQPDLVLSTIKAVA